MEHRDLLQTIAEVGAAFAGFTGVISIFRTRMPEPERLVNVQSARNIIEWSLGTIFASFVPPVVHGLGAGPPAAWRISSALFAGAFLTSTLFGWRRARELARRLSRGSLLRMEAGLNVPAVAVAVGTNSALLANALGLFGAATATVYVVCLLGPLSIAGMIFLRLVIIAARDPARSEGPWGGGKPS